MAAIYRYPNVDKYPNDNIHPYQSSTMYFMSGGLLGYEISGGRLTAEIWNLIERKGFIYYFEQELYYIVAMVRCSYFNNTTFHVQLHEFIHLAALSNRYDILRQVIIRLRDYEYKKAIIIHKYLLSYFKWYSQDIKTYLIKYFLDDKYINYLLDDYMTYKNNNINRYNTLQYLCILAIIKNKLYNNEQIVLIDILTRISSDSIYKYKSSYEYISSLNSSWSNCNVS